MKDAPTDIDRVKQQRKICEVDVEVPTIIIEPFFKGGKPRIFVQWFAEFSPTVSVKHELWEAFVKKFQRMQFRFPALVSLDDSCWMGRPDLFKVVLLGQVQDLRNRATVLRLGKDDDWILWVVSSHYGMKTQYGEGPASFYIPLKIMLGDQVRGLITPKKYYDSAVIDQEREAFEQQGRRWSLRSLNG